MSANRLSTFGRAQKTSTMSRRNSNSTGTTSGFKPPGNEERLRSNQKGCKSLLCKTLGDIAAIPRKQIANCLGSHFSKPPNCLVAIAIRLSRSGHRDPQNVVRAATRVQRDGNKEQRLKVLGEHNEGHQCLMAKLLFDFPTISKVPLLKAKLEYIQKPHERRSKSQLPKQQH